MQNVYHIMQGKKRRAWWRQLPYGANIACVAFVKSQVYTPVKHYWIFLVCGITLCRSNKYCWRLFTVMCENKIDVNYHMHWMMHWCANSQIRVSADILNNGKFHAKFQIYYNPVPLSITLLSSSIYLRNALDRADISQQMSDGF